MPATKTYVAELAVVAALVAAVRPSSDLSDGLVQLPAALRTTLARTAEWLKGSGRAAVEDLAAADRTLVVSRGYNLATAMELALEAQGDGAASLPRRTRPPTSRTGRSSSPSSDVPIVAIRPDGPMGDLRRRHAGRRGTSAVGGSRSSAAREAAAASDDALALPSVLPEALTPLLFIVPGQLLVEADRAATWPQP